MVLQSAGALFGVLLTQTAIVAVAHQSRAHVIHPHDLLLLVNLVRSNESFRQAETFTPVCLPHFNPTAFLHAYVQYLHVVSSSCLGFRGAHWGGGGGAGGADSWGPVIGVCFVT